MSTVGFGGLESLIYKKRTAFYAFLRHRLYITCKNSLLRVQSPEGTKRIELPTNSTIRDLYEHIHNVFKLDDYGFTISKERNFLKELISSRSQTISTSNLKHGDLIYMKQISGSSRRASAASIDSVPDKTFSEASTSSIAGFKPLSKSNDIKEDEVDLLLYKMDGCIDRERDSKLCRHNSNGRCVHCSPLEPYNESYLKQQNIKHLSFHAYIRKLTSGVDGGKFVAFEDINCRIKTGCREHPPWPKGICSKCQPSAITLNRQIYRHVDNVMFENTALVERFLNYWRSTGHQRLGFLYGAYEVNTDVPLGIRARVAAIYEPPQASSRDSIKLLDDEHASEVDEVAKALGLTKIGWIFTDLITEDSAAGTVKHIRGIDTHFLTAHECILAGHLQNSHPNACRFSSTGIFGSKLVTVCVTGDSTKQVHMEGYAVSAQCMALVRDNCLVPTKDAPELGYIRESTDKQYVPDVYYKNWKRWINKSDGGQQRLGMLMKALLLRRTKSELMASEAINCLPEKTMELVQFELDKDEMAVYQKMLALSRSMFAQFLNQQREKHEQVFLTDGQMWKPINAHGAFCEVHKKTVVWNPDKEVKSHEILVLFLRLRQICCHPGLIEQVLDDDEEDRSQIEGFEEENNHKEFDILEEMTKLINDGGNQPCMCADIFGGLQASGQPNVFRKSNKVFDLRRASSKIKKVLEILEEKVLNTEDKAVIISQWTSVLNILKPHLLEKEINFTLLTGSVPVKMRDDIISSFNKSDSGIKVLLLSLTAGGVGLNLVGANHLFLVDLHWNPQLEAQAQDRVFRVGQKKHVYIYKFLSKETVEERIKTLQDQKLAIANGVFSGANTAEWTKLKLDDLKGLLA